MNEMMLIARVTGTTGATRRVLPTRLLLGTLVLIALIFPGLLRASCGSPGNAVEAENCLAGTPQSAWDVGDAGDPTIQGFATDISVNAGQTISFKINTDAPAYYLDIYRMGYYQNNGARLITTIPTPPATLPGQAQPACLFDNATKLVDCGNWAVSASWNVPADAVSGIYFAKLTRTDTGGASHIVFIVRSDSSTSDVLFQTSDETWQAYNEWGGNSLYGPTGAFDITNRAYKVSYNRPFHTRTFGNADFVFYAEYPMVRWLEANGYDVTYFTSVDAAQRGNLITQHKLYLSVGHDEYWSKDKRASIEAARDAGVNLAFFSGNEAFWKTRWESSIDGSNAPYRTLVTYKETIAGAQIDPLDAPPTNIWTGTWRDSTFSPPADGGKPENAVTGTLFRVNGCGSDNLDLSIQIPAADGKMRFWRNTPINTQQVGQTWTLFGGTLGYEWDVDEDNGFRPAGLFHLSTATYNLTNDYLLDYGSLYDSGTATHNLTLYRAASGALVFGAGTVQWSWGLDSNHDVYCAPGSTYPSDANMQQATVNLFADMGVQPVSLQAGLLAASASTDSAPPASTITAPAPGATIQPGTTVVIQGTAADTGGVVGGVEVSTDGGATWHPANGREAWSYTWIAFGSGPVTLRSRAVDDSGNLGAPSAAVSVTIAAPTCPCTIWSPAQGPTLVQAEDTSALELGVKFKADFDGTISGIRFYKGVDNTGPHVGNLWNSSGTLLGTVTFSGETGSGWQQANFGAPIAITGNTMYVASYSTTVGRYSADVNYFTTAGFDNPPLHALQNTIDSPNGVYGTPGAFPANTFSSTNYWVDVVYEPTSSVSLSSITVTPVNPTLQIAHTQQFTATGTYSDSSTQDITSQVNWSSSNTGVATINSSGLATGVAGGTAKMIATLGLVSGNTTVTVQAAPLVISTTSLPPASKGAPYSATLAATGGVQPYTWSLAAGSALPAGLSLATNGQISGAPTAIGPASFTVQAQDSGAKEGGVNQQQTATRALSIVVGVSIWIPSNVPTVVDVGPDNPVELGVKFKSDIAGAITGIRFYKSAANTGAHVGNLWDSSGNLLGSVTFSNETASGWQEADFATPVGIAANTVYVASYHSTVGHESADANFFASAGVDNPPLHALQNGVSGSNGVFAYDSPSCGPQNGLPPCFPNGATTGSNFWVDVAMLSSSATLSSIAVTPVNPTVVVGSTAQFTATGTYSDGSTQNLSAVVTWASSNTNVATINSVGLATTAAIGSSTISATLGAVSGNTTLTVQATPLLITTTLPDGVQDLPYSATLTASGGVGPYTWSLAAGSLPVGLNLSASGQITGTPTVVATSDFTVQVQDSGNPQQTTTQLLSLTVNPPPPFFTIWNPSSVPAVVDNGPDNQVELGVKFQADRDGVISGIRFYKGANNTGTHIGDLWDSAGNLLSTVTFTSETASGWQEADFANPVPITANTVYVASYHTAVGHYSLNANYFASAGVDNPPLHALQNGVSGSNGVYAYDSPSCGPQNGLPPCFPNGTTTGSNFWVDVAFVPVKALSISLDPTSLIGGQGSTGTVTLSNPAPAGGAVVTLASSNTAVANVPANVAVAAGATSGTFAVSTSTVATSTTVNITAPYSGGPEATLTVNPQLASATIVSLTAGTTPSTYGQSLTFTATVSGSGPTPTGSVSFYDGAVCSGTLLASAVALDAGAHAGFTSSSLGAGAHTITACYSGDANYVTNNGSLGQTINVATVTPIVTVSSKAYDGTTAATIATRSLSGVIGSDDVALSGGTATFDDASVGTAKTVTATGLALTGTMAGNYQLSSTSATTTADITTRPITATVDPQSKVYGGADPALTYQVTSGSLLAGDAFTGALSRTAGEDAGIYAILQGSLALNSSYNLSFVGANLTINTAPLTITAADAARQYGQANPVFTGTVVGVVNGDAITGAFGTAADPSSPVGIYPIVPTAVDPNSRLSNYSLALVNGTLTVTPAPLTVTAADASRHYGAPNPAFTGTITGILNNDDISATYSTTATQTSPVGTYPITPALVDPNNKLPNYSLTSNNGTLTITDALSIWSPSSVPSTLDVGTDSPVELGVKFTSDVAGTIAGIRFYKSSGNTGAHLGNLWDSSGHLLGSVSFTSETASGWQEANFATPVAIAANTVYVVSYHASVGHYAADAGYFASAGVDNPPLHALQNGVSGSNGVFAYGASSLFPNGSTTGTNYWVDVVMVIPTATLNSITVNPANPTVTVGSMQAFTATGHYSDSSTQNLTAVVTWASADTNVATIDSFGLATTAAIGTSSISATLGAVSGNTTLTVSPAPLTITTTALPDAIQNQPYSATLAASGGVSPYVWSLAVGSTLPDGLSLSTGGQITGTPNFVGATSFTVQVQDSNSTQDTKLLSITVNAPPPFFTIWSPSTVPGTVDAGPDNPVEVGVKFKADSDGSIAGIRFYKSAANIDTHVGDLWDAAGNLLGSVTFSNETASGWQQADFSTPITITANTEYVVSYHTAVGHYSVNANYFAAAGFDNPPLHALQNSAPDSNGVYAYDSPSCGHQTGQQPCFPNTATTGTNFWVDVAFVPLTVTSVSVTTPVIGGNSSPGTVTLSAAAPAAGAVVTLASDNTAVATVPANVTVPAGATSAPFSVSTSAVATSTPVNIKATYQGVGQATLTVDPRLATTTALSLSAGTNPSTYGQSLTFTATVSGSGPALAGSVSFYDGGTCAAPGATLAGSVDVLNGSGQASVTTSALTAVGSPHTVLACYSGDVNHAGSSGTLLQTVNPAPVTVTGANATRSYGAPNPAFTGTIVGIQNGDNITATFSTAATITSPPGAYDIVPTLADPGAKLGNYSVTINNGVLTITPVTVSSVSVAPGTVIGGSIATGTVTLSGSAPSGGVVVTLQSDTPSAATVPANVTVPEAQTSATFNITTNVVDAVTHATITASLNGNAQVALTVNPGSLLSRTGWSLVSVDSQETSCSNGAGLNAIDGNPNTMWVTQFCGSAAPMPHEIKINLGMLYDLTGFQYLPRQDGCANGWIKQYEFYVSTDGVNWGAPVASGNFDYSNLSKTCPGAGVPAAIQIAFPQTTGQYIRLRALSEVNGNPWTAVAELNLLGTVSASNPPPSLTQVTVNPSIVVGDTSAQGTVSLSGPAPSGGVVVNLSSSDGSATVPLSVTVPANSSSATFTITTSTVESPTQVNISGSSSNGNAQAALMVNPGGLIPQTGWSVTYVDSQQTGNGAGNAIDGSPATYWLTQWSPTSTPMPHEIQINLGASYSLTAFQYLPRQDGCANGWIKQYEFYVSTDGVNWGSPVASGNFDYSNLSTTCPSASVPAAIQIAFSQTTGQYIRLRAISELHGNPWTAVAELNVLGTADANAPPPALTQVTVNPSIVVGGSSVQGTVSLSGPAPSGGVVVNLSSSDGSATVPLSVTVPANSVSANFTVNTSTVGSPTQVNISGSSSNGNAQAALMVNPGGLIPQTGWSVTYVDSQQTGNGAGNAIDGSPATYWLTQWSPTSTPMPHEIQINLGASYSLTGFQYLPRQDGCANGWIKQYEFYVSTDGVNWGSPVASGNFDYSNLSTTCPSASVPAAIQIAFSQTTGQYIRLRAISELHGNPWTAVAEINVLGTVDANAPPPSLTQVTVNPSIVVGGSSVQGTVSLSGPAPSGGVVVNLSSSDGSATVPLSVTVPANSVSANFTVNTSTVGSPTQVNISGSSSNGNAQAALTVNPGGLLSRTGWSLVSVDSQETSCYSGAGGNAIDGSPNTMWVTKFCGSTAPMPHEIQINLGASYSLTAFQYLPRQDGCANGWIKQYEFYVSTDGVNWGSPVASGNFDYSNLSTTCPGASVPAAIQIAFPQTTGQYIRLRALSEINGNPWTAVAEINVLGH